MLREGIKMKREDFQSHRSYPASLEKFSQNANRAGDNKERKKHSIPKVFQKAITTKHRNFESLKLNIKIYIGKIKEQKALQWE